MGRRRGRQVGLGLQTPVGVRPTTRDSRRPICVSRGGLDRLELGGASSRCFLQERGSPQRDYRAQDFRAEKPCGSSTHPLPRAYLAFALAAFVSDRSPSTVSSYLSPVIIQRKT